jgi:hypothetical protein
MVLNACHMQRPLSTSVVYCRLFGHQQLLRSSACVCVCVCAARCRSLLAVWAAAQPKAENVRPAADEHLISHLVASLYLRCAQLAVLCRHGLCQIALIDRQCVLGSSQGRQCLLRSMQNIQQWQCIQKSRSVHCDCVCVCVQL